MKRITVTIGFLFLIVLALAQKNRALLWIDKGNNGKYGIVDTAKNIVVNYKYDEIKKMIADRYRGKEFFRTKLNYKYGIIDRYGHEVILPKYDLITLRTQAADWIETKLDGMYGFVDFCWSEKTEKYDEIKELFQPKYDSTFYSAGETFPSGFIRVKLNNKWGLVDERNGKEITGMKYDKVNDFFFYQGYKWTVVKLNNKFGLIDKTGKETIPCKYDKVVSIEGNGSEIDKIKVRLGNREFFIDENGNQVK